MDKIFKRVPRGTGEGEKEELSLRSEAAQSETKTSETEKPKEKPAKYPADGPAPKFAWKIKPQGEGKAGKSQPDNIPDDLWTKCPHCKELLYSKELENNKKVCHKCGHHFRLNVKERLAVLLDENSFEEVDARLVTTDPLGFSSLAEPSYLIKAAQSRQKSGLTESLISGFGRLEGLPVAISVVDFSYMGGSMGSVYGEKITRLIEAAIEQGLPVVTVNAGGGARMQESIFSLMQMAKTTAALAKLGEAGLPHISVLTDPCTGGIIASYASAADVMIAEPGALIGFAGPRVVEQVTKQKLPPGFQTAEFLLEHGMIDRVVPRKELRQTLATLLGVFQYGAAQKTETEREVSYAG